MTLTRKSVPRLVERYSTSTVASEFIVKFSGFYEESARRGYIAAALAPLADTINFEVVPRDNPMAEYPSDFDVVQLGAEHEVSSINSTFLSVSLEHPHYPHYLFPRAQTSGVSSLLSRFWALGISRNSSSSIL